MERVDSKNLDLAHPHQHARLCKGQSRDEAYKSASVEAFEALWLLSGVGREVEGSLLLSG